MAVTNLISHEKPRSGWVDVTPELAAAILSEGSRNRNIRRKDVIRYAADMKQGLWATTGEAIKFDQDGSLLDGQHRLSAVVDAQITVPMLFVYDIPRASQDVMDSGRKRSLADQLAMRGHTNCNTLAAGIKAARDLETYGKPRANKNDSVVMMLDWFDNNQEIVNSISPVNKASQPPVKYPSGLAIALHFTMSKLGEEEANRFWHVLGYGAQDPGVGAIIVLREKMMVVAAETKRGHLIDTNHRAAYTIAAWNAWLTGRDIKIFRYRPHLGDTFPVLIDPEGI
jgi:hypothetical protein